jgi:hypothetical protein
MNRRENVKNKAEEILNLIMLAVNSSELTSENEDVLYTRIFAGIDL